MQKGYIKLYRKTLDSSVFQDPLYFKLWMYCLMKASHKEHEQLVGNQMIDLKQGQFITGRQALADDLNRGMQPKFKLSELSWWRYLNNLEKWEMLNIKKTNKYSVVTVINWGDYQESEHQMNNKRTTDEQQLNTNKNVKNVKNEKKKEEAPSSGHNAFTFYEENFGIISPFLSQQIGSWLDDFQDQDDILIYAMGLAIMRNKKSWGYVNGILRDWFNKGAKNLKDCEALQKEGQPTNKKRVSKEDFNLDE